MRSTLFSELICGLGGNLQCRNMSIYVEICRVKHTQRVCNLLKKMETDDIMHLRSVISKHYLVHHMISAGANNPLEENDTERGWLK